MIDLPEILRLHQLWLQDDPAGSCADLRNADLRGADLRGADLRGADLQGADLQDADLRNADLSGADLSGADLRGADLSGADLSGADLQGADLWDADLRDAVGLPIVSDAAERLQAVAQVVLAEPRKLQMANWHSHCGTTHCLAGWAIHQAGPIGATLESLHGPTLAGRLLLGHDAADHFHDSNEKALEWLRSIVQ